MNVIDKLMGNEEQDTHAVVPIPERLRKQEKVIIITADNTEDIEFFYPYYRLTEEGYAVDVVTPKGGKFAGKHGLGLNKSVAINDVNPADYALLYIPGGKAPAELRKNDAVISFVKQFAAAGKPIAAICHGPQVLVSADLVRGRQLAAWPEVAKEIEEAGGTFVDEALVEDGTFITGRKPGDLHRHLYGVLQYLKGKVADEPRNERKSHSGYSSSKASSKTSAA
jgi:protease I